MEKIQKVALVDGMACHKYQYSFVVNTDYVKIANKGVKATVIRELNYNTNSYYEVEINGKNFYIKKTQEIEYNEIYLDIDFSNATIVNKKTNIIVA